MYPTGHLQLSSLRRSVDTFIDMQQEFLKIGGKQTENWLAVAQDWQTCLSGA